MLAGAFYKRNSAFSRLILMCAVLSTLTVSALAADYTYVNPRFGTHCTFPADIFSEPQPEPENGDGQEWLSADGARLVCSGMFNVMDETPESYVASEKASQTGDYTITYSKSGKDWAVLSGYREGNVFYQRRLFGRDEVIRSVWIEYPPALKAKYDPLAGRIAKSLRGP